MCIGRFYWSHIYFSWLLITKKTATVIFVSYFAHKNVSLGHTVIFRGFLKKYKTATVILALKRGYIGHTVIFLCYLANKNVLIGHRVIFFVAIDKKENCHS